MDWYKLVSYYYSRGYYDNADVSIFLLASKITPEQYQAITGEVYVPEGEI